MIYENNFENEMIYIMMESNEMVHNLNISMIKLEHHAIINENEKLLNEGAKEMATKLIEIIKKTLLKIKEWFRKVLSFIAEKLSKLKKLKNVEDTSKDDFKDSPDMEVKNKEEANRKIEEYQIEKEKLEKELKEKEDNFFSKKIKVHSDVNLFKKFLEYLIRYKNRVDNYDLSNEDNTANSIIEMSLFSSFRNCKNINDLRDYLRSDIIEINFDRKLIYDCEKYNYNDYTKYTSKLNELLNAMYDSLLIKLDRVNIKDNTEIRMHNTYKMCADFFSNAIALYTSSLLERLDIYNNIVDTKNNYYLMINPYVVRIKHLNYKIDMLKKNNN